MGRTKPFLLITLVFIFVILACNAQLPQSEPTLTAAPTEASSVSTQLIEPTITPSAGTSNIPLTEAEVPRVPVKEAKAAFDGGQAIILDVRSPEAYAASHVMGAINIQLGEIETNPTGLNLDKNQWIITYCT
jgi:hydroxyacylglutathione hydrolase